MAVITPYVPNQYFDDSGDPLNGGLLYWYTAGTSNAKEGILFSGDCRFVHDNSRRTPYPELWSCRCRACLSDRRDSYDINSMHFLSEVQPAFSMC